MGISEAIKSINAAAASPGNVSEEERVEALRACERLKASLETPFEYTLRVIFSAHQTMGLRLGIDMGLFDVAAAATNKNDHVTIEQLASGTGADIQLVTRIMRLLVGMEIFKELSRGVFASTLLSRAYASSSPLSAAVIHVTHFIAILSRLPDYFEENGFQNPGDVYNGPFQYAMGTNLHYFDYIATKPKLQKAFNTVMTISHRRRGQQWFTFYPVEKKLVVQLPTAPLLVDVGGGLGDDLIAFKQNYPTLPGRLIVQDLPIVIKNAKDIPPGIEAMGHDFFSRQPIIGAKAYYLRTVLHDWPDQQARQILSRIREAMGPESILLINETMLPESNVALSSAQADLTMMVTFASLERTQKQFEKLLNETGFDLVGVWMPKNFKADSATLAEQATLLEAVAKRGWTARRKL